MDFQVIDLAFFLNLVCQILSCTENLALKNQINPEKLVILGTSGSMWDVLCEHIGTDSHEHWASLSDAVETDAVNQPQLDAFALPISQTLQIDCQLIRIPYGDNLEQQIEILRMMAAAINAGDTVSLDLTHGLRHLPMLGLLSAMYLQTARQVEIKGIYYGALDRTKNNLTPVMQLDGLLNIAEWITALHGFDKTGDIAPFADLLKQEGVADDTANLLKTAAFHESVLNITNARRPLRDFADKTKNGLPGIGSLFADSLNERISWKNQNTLYLRQREKALFYLKQGDYVRAALLGFEAVITCYIEKHNSSSEKENYAIRLQAKDDLEKELARGSQVLKQSYEQLRDIRNALAHTNRSNNIAIEKIFQSENCLQATLTKLLNDLLPLN